MCIQLVLSWLEEDGIAPSSCSAEAPLRAMQVEGEAGSVLASLPP